ncbi:hypothetical protein GIB67_008744 [Kingdonia uniflora]|uniref:Endoglucanase n=1 Tax=Kingdonia uniflora TaxID=39325 RepID=A0A7J7P5H1_9MAGN|nr:hypothetical protein GIB67_008744 [Kingdonia uniflora]
MARLSLVVVVLVVMVGVVMLNVVLGMKLKHNYTDALSKSILFFEGQRSGKLPFTLRMKWRKDSGLCDGHQISVGDPYEDHNCWQRPEDMDTPRTPYAISRDHPGSKVAAETAAALAASSIMFRVFDPRYSVLLLQRAIMVFDFSDKYRGSYNDSLGPYVCPFYCDYNGYEDELLWAAAWLHRTTKAPYYWNYVANNIYKIESKEVESTKKRGLTSYSGGSFAEFGWDAKHAGINIFVSKVRHYDFLLYSNTTGGASTRLTSFIKTQPGSCVQYCLNHPQKASNTHQIEMGLFSSLSLLLLLLPLLVVPGSVVSKLERKHDYADALMKSILFFEGQRSGKLPSSQRMTWRKDSALNDGHQLEVDLVGGYYDAGDNIKFNFPMAFSTTMLAWSVLEFGKFMGPELEHAKEAVKWGTDYLLKSTEVPDMVFVQVGEPDSDHNCWERSEDMDTPRIVSAVTKDHPGSEVAAETAAALASASIIFRKSDPRYSQKLLARAIEVFNFADKYRGSYNTNLARYVCPFYCDFSGYEAITILRLLLSEDELLWAATWLHKATNDRNYWSYVKRNFFYLHNYNEFGWDNKDAGVTVLISTELLRMKMPPMDTISFRWNADKFICSVLPESPTSIRTVNYSAGGLLFKQGGSNTQHTTAISFLLLVHARHLNRARQSVQCGNEVVTPHRLERLAKSQVDYLLGSNPLGMSYMVGYGNKFPQRIHHRGSTLPSIDQHPNRIGCKDGTPYFENSGPNHNNLIGAVVGGPALNDTYSDSRGLFIESEPTTYINAPLVGILAFFAWH